MRKQFGTLAAAPGLAADNPWDLGQVTMYSTCLTAAAENGNIETSFPHCLSSFPPQNSKIFYDSAPQCLKRRLRSFMELPVCCEL